MPAEGPSNPSGRGDARTSVGPTRIGQHYHVIEQLGRGGAAIVYRVRDAAAQREVALKQLISRGSERDRAARVQFEREYYVLAQLSHPSVIEVYDYGLDLEGPFYTMELLDGGDLSARAPISYTRACELMVQLCSSLSLLHSRKLVHRDVSPRNVRCTRAGRAKLIDFGAMLPIGPCVESVGTPGFVAPEVVKQLAVGPRTDLYSLGATLYYALTGKKPYPARTLAELSELWNEEPPAPSKIRPDIPEAMDALVLSLLQLDPHRRPASAFEVMQRLAAIAGLPRLESDDIAQVYLKAPALVGREIEQRRFRQQLRRVGRSDGGCLLFAGEPGSGRSRLLASCEIEAKLAGATVLSLAARRLRPWPLSAAHAIAERALTQLPDASESFAQRGGAASALLTAADGGLRVRPLETLAGDRAAAGAELTAWLRALCERHTVMLAIDDVERIDPASLAWLASLAQDAREQRLLVVATFESPGDGASAPQLALLRSRAIEQTLGPLSAEQTGALFTSIFSGAPHTALVSHRIHRLSAGNPRESIALARDLLERGLIRYSGGGFSLPAELAGTDLPTSVEDAVRQRLLALPALARTFAEAQALAFEGPWTRDDYERFAGAVERGRVADALGTLVHQGVLVGDGSYTLSQLGVRQCLVQGMTPAARAMRHAQLADFYVASGRTGAIEVHHRLSAGDASVALDRMDEALRASPSLQALCDASAIDRKTLVGVLEQACTLAVATQRPPREVHALLQRLLELSSATDDSLYARYAERWLAQLELDSGVADYRAADRNTPMRIRLQRARALAAARYETTPERDRVYRPDEALELLSLFTGISLSVATRRAETELFASLPAILEPVAAVSPFYDLLLDVTIAARDLNARAHPDHARRLMLAAYERIKQIPVAKSPYAWTWVFTIAQMLAVAEVHLGRTTAEQWIEVMETSPLHRLAALHLRRVLSILDGDTEAAERYRKQAELLAIQTDGFGLVPARLELELMAYHHVGDLAGVKQVADRLEHLARKAPGWRAMHQYALGVFQWLRGDRAAAIALLEAALESSDPQQVSPPPHLNVWVRAAAAYIATLTEVGRAKEALARGRELRALAMAIDLPIPAALEHALAQAESKVGNHAAAAARLEALIARRDSVRPAILAADYEARALVAIAAKDARATEHFVRLASEQFDKLPVAARMARQGRLHDAAKQAGLALSNDAGGTHSGVVTVLSKTAAAAADPRLLALDQVRDAGARAARVLSLLRELAGARNGHLYYAQPGRLRCVARTGARADSALDTFVQAYLQQRLENEAMTTVFTEYDEPHKGVGTFSSADGTEYRLALLQCPRDETCVGLVALSGADVKAFGGDFAPLSAAISAKLLVLGDAGEF